MQSRVLGWPRAVKRLVVVVLDVVLEQDSSLQVVAEAGDGETALRMAAELLDVGWQPPAAWAR